MSLNSEQPDPIPNEQPAVWELVIQDMLERNQIGIKKYGTPLQPWNGRNALVDAYQEALDLCVYLRQAIYERGCLFLPSEEDAEKLKVYFEEHKDDKLIGTLGTK